jgi:hypothetical protein
MCALISLTVRREREIHRHGRNLASEVQVVNDTTVVRVVPSICKKEGVSDGLVNSRVTINDGTGITYLWCTQDVATISALT